MHGKNESHNKMFMKYEPTFHQAYIKIENT